MNLQYQWDVALITGFYLKPHNFVTETTKKFIEKHAMDYEEFNKLLRVPRYVNMTTYRTNATFIGLYIPKLANLLYRHDITDVFDIAEKLKNSKLDVGKYKDKKSQDKKELEEDSIRYTQHKLETELSKEVFKSHRRSEQWLKTK